MAPAHDDCNLRSLPAGRRSLSGVSHFASLKLLTCNACRVCGLSLCRLSICLVCHVCHSRRLFIQPPFHRFTSLTSSPSFLKTELLRGSPVKGRPRKDWSVRTAYTYPTESEWASFDSIQAAFQDPQWLSHWDRTRRLYFDIDAS
jgi:hypothetical protein